MSEITSVSRADYFLKHSGAILKFEFGGGRMPLFRALAKLLAAGYNFLPFYLLFCFFAFLLFCFFAFLLFFYCVVYLLSDAREKNGKFGGKRLVEFAFKMAGQCSASVLYYLYYY